MDKDIIEMLENERSQRILHKSMEKLAISLDPTISDIEKKLQADRLTTFFTFTAKIRAEREKDEKEGKTVKRYELPQKYKPYQIDANPQSDSRTSQTRENLAKTKQI